MLKRLFGSHNKAITLGALILGVSYFISALLGLWRDRLLAGRFGASLELDVYFAAFRIPDLVYNILILGGLAVAFIPLFAEYFSRDQKESWRMVNHVLNAFSLFLAVFSLALFILAPWLVGLLLPGFDASYRELALPLIRLFLLSPIIFGVSNIFSGILQYFHRFFAYGLTPILYNLGIILGIFFLAPKYGIFGVGFGVIIGALMHLGVQIIPAVKCGFKYRPMLDFHYPAIKRIFILMFPRVFGVAAQQVNLFVITAIASTVASGTIAIFNFSNNLQSLPVGLVGVSLAVAAFPSLARNIAAKQKEDFLANFSSISRQILLFSVPVSILIFLLRDLIVNLIYKTGRFALADSQLTAACLGLFALSIFAQSLIPLLVRAFFSFQDTRTPTLITFLCVALNIGLSFFLVFILRSTDGAPTDLLGRFLNLSPGKELSILGLPLAFSVSAILQFVLLQLSLKIKIKKAFSDGEHS